MSESKPSRQGPPLIGFFDSGVGGLSVLDATRRRLPSARFAYCADNAHFPYGTKSEDEVVRVVLKTTGAFTQKAQLDFLVIACNTASTIALKAVREALALPVIGVVPAIKPAASLSRTGTIALLATKTAAQTAYADELIRSFASHCQVLRAGSSRLVELAEAKLRGESVSAADVRPELEPLFAASPEEPSRRLDTVVLGCTHFPLLQTELAEASPWPVRWLDSGEAIASRIENLANGAGFAGAAMKRGEPQAGVAYFTRTEARLDALRPALAALGLQDIEVLP